jgi:hypothetical protein
VPRPVDTRVPAAIERARGERAVVDAKLDAYDTFVDRVRDVTTDAASGGAPTPVGTTVATGTNRGGCAAVRDAFDATVRDVAGVGDGESVFETMAAELGEELAVALAPTTGSALTPEFREQVVSGATDRRFQLRTMASALDRELSSLESAREDVETIREWLERADGTPLTALEYDELRARHERLDDYRARCERRARKRQALLDGSTGEHGRVGLEHRCLVDYLYEDLPVEHPVLDGVTTAVETCERCQRNVRAHLTRCV